MDEVRIIGKSVPAMPWQERPEGHVGPLWRHTANPIIKRNPVKGVARVFNSAVAP